MAGQLCHHAIAPLRLLNFAAEALANLPVQINPAGVNGLHRALPGGGDEGGDFLEIGLVNRRWFIGC